MELFYVILFGLSLFIYVNRKDTKYQTKFEKTYIEIENLKKRIR